MKSNWIAKIVVASIVSTMGILIPFAGSALAHCDSTSGPIIPEAQAALEKGEVTPILKWVRKDYEPEIKAAFAETVAVRNKKAEKKELADHHFMETLIRLHREGEGASVTGISDDPVEPVVAMSDKAIADGSADYLIKEINHHMALAIREKLEKVMETKKHKDKSVEAGREFVEAYVTYTHYVEGIHAAITSAADHHTETKEISTAHKH